MTNAASGLDPNPQLQRDTEEECLATWWHQATPGTTYWRCLVPARHLPGQTIPFTEPDLQEKEGKPFLPRQRGTAIWQFLGDPHRTRIALGMRDLYGTRTLMELDDNYLRPAPYLKGKAHSPWKETAKEAASSGTHYSHEMHRQVVPEMDGLIVSTDFLADVYSEYHDNIYVCPNSIDPADWEYEREEPDGIFRIVYYGSVSHVSDAPIIKKAMKWAARQKDVEVWTVGFSKRDWTFPHRSIAWTAHLNEARKNLFKFDLSVAPLKRNAWANAKSDIKALESAMAGALPLMSRAESFRPWFRDFPDLVLSDEEWVSTVMWAVKNQDEVKARAAEAKIWVLENRAIDKTIHNWRLALA